MPKSHLVVIVSLVFLLAKFFGLIWFEQDQATNIEWGKKYTFEAEVVQIDKKINGWQVVLRPQNLSGYQGLILSYRPLYPEPDWQELWQLTCRLERPQNFSSNDRVFFYEQYLAKDKIFALCSWPQVKVLGQRGGATHYFYRVKRYLWQNLNHYLVEPASSFAKALLLSSRREVPPAVNQVFAQVGLSHIIAISGMHMVILAWLLNLLLLALGFNRKHGTILILALVLFYLFLTGLPGSAVRATVMIYLVILGGLFGRHSSPFYSLLIATDILVALNPKILLYDIGWQLSCLAVLGLLCYGNFFEHLFRFLPNFLKLREVLAVTLAAQVFTTPLILYYFGFFSLVSPLANFLILPISTAILVLALALGIFGFWPWLGQALGWVLFLLMKAMVLVATYLAGWPGAYIKVVFFPWHYLLISLLLLAGLTLVMKPYSYEKI